MVGREYGQIHSSVEGGSSHIHQHIPFLIIKGELAGFFEEGVIEEDDRFLFEGLAQQDGAGFFGLDRVHVDLFHAVVVQVVFGGDEIAHEISELPAAFQFYHHMAGGVSAGFHQGDARQQLMDFLFDKPDPLFGGQLPEFVELVTGSFHGFLLIEPGEGVVPFLTVHQVACIGEGGAGCELVIHKGGAGGVIEVQMAEYYVGDLFRLYVENGEVGNHAGGVFEPAIVVESPPEAGIDQDFCLALFGVDEQGIDTDGGGELA